MTPTAPTNAPAADAPVTLFYSYAHEDEPLRDELQDHLMILERRRVIRSWHDRAIVPGHDWSREIDEHLRAADVVLLLISKDFIASDYIMGIELELAMQRQQRGETRVVPILLRPVDLQPEDAEDMPFVALLKPQGLPRDLKPVTSWDNRDEAWTDVAAGLRRTVNAIRATRQPAAGPQAPAVPAAPEPAAAPQAPTVAPADSARMERVLDDVATRLADAQRVRGGDAPDAPLLRDQALRLIDARGAHRVLWVDDRPSNNVREAAALARLQIEVAAARSTDEALARLAAADTAGEPFDLVISDWSRADEAPLAGLRLLTSLRRRGHTIPVIYYHGTTGALARATLAAAARAAGAFGEAAMPAELMALVSGALDS